MSVIAGKIAKMNKKIFKSVLTVVIVVLVSCLICVTGVLYAYFDNIQNTTMKEEMSLIQTAVEKEGKDFLITILDNDDDYRVTWISNDGTVIYDSQKDNLENHSDRQEFKDAIEKGEGFSRRYSKTILEKTDYYAKRISDGSVLRIAKKQATVTNLMLGMVKYVLILFVLAILMTYFLAKKVAESIIAPLNNLNLDEPLNNEVYDEVAPLLSRIYSQHKQIDEQIDELARKNDQFSQITDNLKECLILLDSEDRLININKSAKDLFSVENDCIGKDIVFIDRDPLLSECMNQAKKIGHSEFIKDIRDKFYQFDLSSINYEGKLVGIVILAFDITERQLAENSRREFSANVSHELKTPLQGIIGSAELIENNMVKNEDLPRFVSHIKNEAQRMVTLINDIIKLSQLDEGNTLQIEEVNLAKIANNSLEQIKLLAERKNITITSDIEEVKINGVAQLLSEMVYNLLDNAIKYNKENGTVLLKINKIDNNAVISVKDSGIGIAKEDQERVFERFYRVDKSHSKATGGTGLGLSIVKHTVLYHHGKIEINSELNKGTEIKIILPSDNK